MIAVVSGASQNSIGKFNQLALAMALGVAACLTLTVHPAAAQSNQDGQQVFTSAGCSGCHGATGNGGIGPRLAGDQKLATASTVIGRILNGGGSMPAFKDKLSNDQIAAVATYIRTNFGNQFGPVTADEVAKVAQGGGAAGAGNAGSPNAAAPANGAAQGQSEESQPAAENGAAKPPQMDVGAPAANVAQPTSSGPDQAALDAADEATDSWLMYNKGYTGQRYSSLDQITTRNVGDLQPVCIAQLGVQSPFQGSPIVYDGLLYITTAYSVYAIDAKTCKQKWAYTYTPSGTEPLNTNRGIAIAGGRVFRGTPDAHFIALDAKTGKLLWNIRPVDSSAGYFLSSAPIVWNDLVFTGTAGADWGAPAQMFAFDVKDGHTVWTFDEVADETFGGADPAATGGGSNWTSYSLDTKTGLIYISVGNPAPDFAAQYRPGTNLYTNSVLVLDAKNGKLDHYYQQIPNDALDRDTAAAPILYRAAGDNGDETLHIAVANKAGHLFSYDEATKKEVFKVETTTLKNDTAPPTTKGTHVCPGIDGGVEWNGPAYDPGDKTLFVPSVDWCTTFTLGEVRYTPGQLFFGGSYENDPVDQAQGWIRAFDAKTGKTKWMYKSDLPVVAAVTPTKGGVLFSGELTGDFIALDLASGKKLYHFYTGGPIAGGVSTYEIDGKQYVAVASGNESRTWSPDVTPSATLLIFGLPDKSGAGKG